MDNFIPFLCDHILLFITFSVAGWCMEVFLKYREFHRFINRGFLVGPYLPIYGFGAVSVTLVMELLGAFDNSLGTTFVMAFVVCGVIEYLASYYLEKRFHARWWDYTGKPMNLNGRVWIGNLILFGLGGTVIVKVIDPAFFSLTARIPLPVRGFLSFVLGALFAADFVFSHFIMKMIKMGVESSTADNTEAIGREIRLMMSDKTIFHQRFVNAYPEVVYRTERINRKLNEIRRETEEFRNEISERLDEEREALVYRLEPAAFIKNDIIEKQTALIDSLKTARELTDEESTLMAEIDSRLVQLSSRENRLTRIVSVIRQKLDDDADSETETEAAAEGGAVSDNVNDTE